MLITVQFICVGDSSLTLRMREPEALPVAVRKQEFFIRNALIGHCLVTTLFPHFSKKFSVKYFLLASRKVLLVNFSAKRKSNNEKECFADRRSAITPLFALTPGHLFTVLFYIDRVFCPFLF